MGKRFLILFFISALSALSCFSQTINSDNRLREIISRNGQAEVTIAINDVTSFEILTINTSILSVKDKIVHVSLSPITVEWFISQRYQYGIVERSAIRGIVSSTGIEQAMQWDSYPSYAQYDSIMRNFAFLYPSLCRLDTIGTSIYGKLVLALKISNTPGSDKDSPRVFYTSTMHGDETGGFIMMLHLADYLLKNYNTSNRVKNLVDNLEIWINPLANPDGTYGTGNLITNPTRFNADGYDLNRNFPDPFTPNTIKQKETLDVIKFMRKHKFSLSANFHAGTEVVNYPWDRWLTKLHADDSWFNGVSRAYADTVHKFSSPAYMNFLDNGVTRGALWYLVYGGRQDFMTWELHGREVTIELDDQYITPPAQLTLLWQNNWHSLIGYLENALFGIHGKVRNATSLGPVAAKVFIQGHDTDSSQVYSDTLSGSFVRYLSPGLWNLTFTAVGYQALQINNVVVTSGQRTDLIADMIPASNKVENPKASFPVLLFPNPARNEIQTLLPDTMNGTVNIRIISSSGILVSDYNTYDVQGTPVRIDIKSLSAGIYSLIILNTNARISCHGRFVVVK